MHGTSGLRLSVLFVLSILTSSLAGQAIEVLIIEGDTVPGAGTVVAVDNLAINSSGDWLAEVLVDSGAGVSSLLLKNGQEFLRESDSLLSPSGSTIDSFDSLSLDDVGRSAFNFELGGTVGMGDDAGVYENLDPFVDPLNGTTLVVQEGDDDPGVGGVPILGFFDVKLGAPNQILVAASVDDPTVLSPVDRALYLWSIEPLTGAVATSTRVVIEGDTLPGQSSGVIDIGTGPQESSINTNGVVLFAVDVPGADSLYVYDGSYELIAREGSPSPVAGRDWQSLTGVAVDINDHGLLVYRGILAGDPASDSVIVRGSRVFRQEGASVLGYALTSFGTGPVEVSNDGRVLWYGDWDDPDSDVDTGLFIDDELIVQEGVTSIPGLGVVDTLRGSEDGYHLSPNGQFVIFESVLDTGLVGAFRVELAPPATPTFRRGDTNQDGSFDIGDPVSLLSQLFGLASPAPCADAADSNDDGAQDISDVVFALSSLFVLGAPAPSAPGSVSCGIDPTPDGLSCFATCP